jgi:hypothetical protein
MNADSIKHQCIALAHQFRLGQSVEAALLLPDAMQAVLNVLPQLSLSAQSELSWVVARLLQCQEAKDWLGLADYLEYELNALLSF